MTNLAIIFNAILSDSTAEKSVMWEKFDKKSLTAFFEKYGFLPLQTYQGWKNKGYQVQRGEKSIMQLRLWKYKGKKGNEAEENEDIKADDYEYVMPTSYMFDFSQVAKIENNTPEKAAEKQPEKAESTKAEKSKSKSVAAKTKSDSIISMNFNYAVAEKVPAEKKKYNMPNNQVKALQKYVNKNLKDTSKGSICHTISKDKIHGDYIIDGYTAVYLDKMKSYDLGIEDNPNSPEKSFIPEYTEFNSYTLNLKELKAAYKAYKDSTKNKNGFFKLNNTYLDAKMMVDILSIITSDNFAAKVGKEREIVTYESEYGKAIQCPVNPNGMDEKMVIGSIA